MPESEVYHLYRATLPDRGIEVLVTIWPDGTATVASRTQYEWGSWGPPTGMVHLEAVPIEEQPTVGGPE
jgi:hypothetical protein